MELLEKANYIISQWASVRDAGSAGSLEYVFEKAYAYRMAKRTADNHREAGRLTAEDVAEEERSAQDFKQAWNKLDGEISQAG